MINNVVLVGRLTRDPELRYTPSNVASVSFTIAVDRQFQSANGERQADFISCVAWRQSAEFLAKYVKKGVKILADDGKVSFEVIRIEGKNVVCKVLNNAALSNRKSINIPK